MDNRAKKYYILLLLVVTMLISACSENELITEEGNPKINYISPNPTFVGDTISIYGENLGNPGLESYIVLSGALKDTIIHSTKCLQWTISKVTFVVPMTTAVRVNLVCNGTNTDFLDITIKRLPDLMTSEVPSGSFIMGSIFGLKDELPEHKVEITKPLIVSVYEINQFYYYQVMRENNSKYKDNRLPADSITWIKAIEFCNNLSILQGLKPVYTIFGENAQWDTTADGWRLPTEAEWEYICRAGDTNDYSGSTDLNKVGWYNMNSGLKPHPSGMKQKNAFGLYDLHGNLWEWCWDFYDSQYYEKAPAKNPKGPDAGSKHIARGGSYMDGN
jgi:hypothetical protein